MIMTSRVGKPDTDTDINLRLRLAADGKRHFVMIAGAGSGKTTSLIKALEFLKGSVGRHLGQCGQQIACITYTDLAVDEISGDVGHDPIIHVSTIHSFLWAVCRAYQSDIKEWVSSKLQERIEMAQQTIDKPRVRQATIEKEQAKIQFLENELQDLKQVVRFRYGTGSDYSNGVLGHSDILKMGPALIVKYPLMRQLVSQRYPVIFVDESQDTDPDFVSALKTIAADVGNSFCLGFFGDPEQKVYPGGIGEIELEEGWSKLEKPENFRSPKAILDVINRIRAEADGLMQTRGKMVEREGQLESVVGSARLFILPADERRAERLIGVRKWLAEHNEDVKWISDKSEDDVRMLVIVHRMAANRLGFPQIYSALNDRAPETFKSGLIDGTAWIVRPLTQFLLPLVERFRAGDDFRVMTMLKSSCPRMDPEYLSDAEVSKELDSLSDDIAALSDLLQDQSGALLGDVLQFVLERNLYFLDERFHDVLKEYASGGVVVDEAPENSALRFLQCATKEIWGYRVYIENQSPFATQQGIKGAEFDRVLVVIDDEENTMNSFSYGKYFGLMPLSDTDIRNREQGKETVVDRTRKLFYVCCSRASRDLAVVIFTDDVDGTHQSLEGLGYFTADNIYKLEI